MKKLLIYSHRKQDPIVWDISTPIQAAAAFLALFHILDSEWEVYTELQSKQVRLHDAALQGDVASAIALMFSRKSYEYEGFEVVEVRNPLPMVKTHFAVDEEALKLQLVGLQKLLTRWGV